MQWKWKNHEYISIYDYPRVAGFVKGLGVILQDSVPRFFIHEKVKNYEVLQEMVYFLYVGGITFNKRGTI